MWRKTLRLLQIPWAVGPLILPYEDLCTRERGSILPPGFYRLLLGAPAAVWQYASKHMLCTHPAAINGPGDTHNPARQLVVERGWLIYTTKYIPGEQTSTGFNPRAELRFSQPSKVRVSLEHCSAGVPCRCFVTSRQSVRLSRTHPRVCSIAGSPA